MSLQVAHHGIHQLGIGPGGTRRGHARHAELCTQSPHQRAHLGSAHRRAVVGQRPKRCGGTFEGVKAAHFAVGIPLRGNVARVGGGTRQLVEDVAVNADHHVGAAKVVDRSHGLARGQHSRLVHQVAVAGFPLIPSGIGVLAEEIFNGLRQGGRGHVRRDDGDAAVLQRGANILEEVRPVVHIALVLDPIEAIRIVQAVDTGELLGIQTTQTGGVLGVTFQLDRTAFVAAHQHADDFTGDAGRGGEVLANPGNPVLGGLHIADDLLLRHDERAAARTGNPGHGHGAPHQLEDIAAINLGNRLAVRELVPLPHAGLWFTPMVGRPLIKARRRGRLFFVLRFVAH